jgi:hypothetical protein
MVPAAPQHRPGLLIILTPAAGAPEWAREDRNLAGLRRGVRRLLYRSRVRPAPRSRYLRSGQGGPREAASTAHRLQQLIPELHECMEINYNKRIIRLETEMPRVV